MKVLRSIILPILLATVWISISEFVRNEFLLKSYWTEHYEGLGLVFPSEPINGALWGLWSLLFAVFMYILTRKFCPGQATLIGWLAAFAMMWVVTGNLDVLPLRILWYAVPLSLLEAFVAALITWGLAKPASDATGT